MEDLGIYISGQSVASEQRANSIPTYLRHSPVLKYEREAYCLKVSGWSRK